MNEQNIYLLITKLVPSFYVHLYFVIHLVNIFLSKFYKFQNIKIFLPTYFFVFFHIYSLTFIASFFPVSLCFLSYLLFFFQNLYTSVFLIFLFQLLYISVFLSYFHSKFLSLYYVSNFLTSLYCYIYSKLCFSGFCELGQRLRRGA